MIIPKLIEEKSTILDYDSLWDVMKVKYDDTELLVATCRQEGIMICDTTSDFAQRIISGKLPGMQKKLDAIGVAYDERGHLFVCDDDKGNRCIQMFSLPDGKYLGCLIREGEQGLGIPCRICWCQESSSLVVHWKDRQWQISVISVEY